MAKKKSGKQQQQQGSDGGADSSTVGGGGGGGTDTGGGGTSTSPSVTTAGDNNTGTDTYITEEEEELELLQVDLGDMVKIKQVMDETVASTLLEHLPEDYKWDNFKLFIMALACMFAMIAQFAPIPFPESRPVLGICGSLYFAFSGILQLITTFVDQDSILWTLPLSKENNTITMMDGTTKISTTTNKDMEKYGLVVRTNLERFSEWYTVTIEFHPDQVKQQQKQNDKTKKPSFVHQRWSIGQFFDKEGYFDEIGVSQEVMKLFERFEKGDYDRSDDPDSKPKKE